MTLVGGQEVYALLQTCFGKSLNVLASSAVEGSL